MFLDDRASENLRRQSAGADLADFTRRQAASEHDKLARVPCERISEAESELAEEISRLHLAVSAIQLRARSRSAKCDDALCGYGEVLRATRARVREDLRVPGATGR